MIKTHTHTHTHIQLVELKLTDSPQTDTGGARVGWECDLTCTAAPVSTDSWTPVPMTTSGLSNTQLWLPPLIHLNLTLFIK